MDGHYVKSNPETVVDDILYELRIVHCYEKKVPIDMDEQAVTCDWFIPVLDNRRGITSNLIIQSGAKLVTCIEDILDGDLKILGTVDGVGTYTISCEDIKIVRRYTGEDVTYKYYNYSYDR